MLGRNYSIFGDDNRIVHRIRAKKSWIVIITTIVEIHRNVHNVVNPPMQVSFRVRVPPSIKIIECSLSPLERNSLGCMKYFTRKLKIFRAKRLA